VDGDECDISLLLLFVFEDIATISTCDAPFRGWFSNAFQGNPDAKSSKKPAVSTAAAALRARMDGPLLPDRRESDNVDSGELAAGRRARNDRRMDETSLLLS
jgi:hypothetical protein